MNYSRATVVALADRYLEEEPLAIVEQEHVETLPATFRDGAYGRRDVEWIVQWYFRRHLGAYRDRERRSIEDAFGENDFENVHDTLAVAAAARTNGRDDLAGKLDALTAIYGVTIGVASAFLFFVDPDRYVPFGRREGRGLLELGAVTKGVPELDAVTDEVPELDALAGDVPELDTEIYLDWHAACTNARDTLDVDAWTLYRALWLLGDPN